jgi:hypothetical protein
MKKTVVFTLFVFGMTICLASNLCFATIWDVAADFSATNNPNGVWSYGWSSELTSALNLYSYPGKFDDMVPIDVWAASDVPYSTPNVSHNGTGSIVTTHPTIKWETGQFALHPGEFGEYSHACWTAPYAGTFDIVSTFTGIDIGTTTTDVHVLLIHNNNSISLFNEGVNINGYGNTSPFSKTVSVGMGDIIDFAVGYGNGNHTRDTTALSATIIPEPATLLLLTLGGLTVLRKKK